METDANSISDGAETGPENVVNKKVKGKKKGKAKKKTRGGKVNREMVLNDNGELVTFKEYTLEKTYEW
jgi:hypothetical protein